MNSIHQPWLTPNRLVAIVISLQLLMTAAFIGTLLGITHVQQVQNRNHENTNATLDNIQKEMICIGAFFDQPGVVRSQTSIATLKACQPALKANH